MKKAPKSYRAFVDRYPKLGEAWDSIREAEEQGPLDETTRRLVKLAIAVGAMRTGAVHSAVRKAAADGVPREAMEQIVALAASTIGLPSAVAVHGWIDEALVGD